MSRILSTHESSVPSPGFGVFTTSAAENLRPIATTLGRFVCGGMVVLGGYLLFQLQPVVAKQLLPWFGGGVAVWSACQLFFQLALLAGYLYAFLLTRFCALGTQAVVHTSLLLIAFLLFPSNLTVGDSLEASEPIGAILTALAGSIGLKFFALAATSPLVQIWYTAFQPSGVPSRLFALSNAASLVALLSYPFVLEPMFTNSSQLFGWNVGFVAYTALAIAATLALRLLKIGPTQATAIDTDSSETLTLTRYISWIALSAIGSITMLAVTNHICTEISVTPLLWVLPLALYLISFVIAFDKEKWFLPRPIAFATAMSIGLAAFVYSDFMTDTEFPLIGYLSDWSLGEFIFDFKTHIGLFLLWMFAMCVLSHGELARCKPRKQKLPVYYLCIATGGAIGGIIVNYGCPIVFSSYHELKLIAAVGVLLAAFTFGRQAQVTASPRDVASNRLSRIFKARQIQGVAIGCFILIVVANARWTLDTESSVFSTRNFYGVLRMKLVDDEHRGQSGAALHHGGTLHGFQYFGKKSKTPTTYYCRRSGVGLAMSSLEREGGRRVGVVGLGVGTLAAYGEPGDRITFYEIDEKVKRIANDQFTFLRDSDAEIEIVMGDARVSLDREESRNYDMLVLDAFSGDGIPTHLLTREAFEIYGRHIAPDGILAVHVSNRYLNLIPVVRASAERFGYEMVFVDDTVDRRIGDASSDWLILGRAGIISNRVPLVQANATESILLRLPSVEWTDDFANLLSVMR